MTTDAGRAFIMARLCDAPDLNGLRKVWVKLGTTYQRDPEIVALKDKLKAQMEGQT